MASSFITHGCDVAGSTFLRALFLCAAQFLLAGCQWPSIDLPASDDHVAEFRFRSHSFGASCWETTDCSVLYANYYHVRQGSELRPPLTREVLDRESGGYLGIRNFPGPAIVKWRSRDGISHEAVVDIADIFKDQRMLHRVRADEVRSRAVAMNPSIILVVNDRTINVYMRASVPLAKQRYPDHPHSDMARDLVLAYAHTY